jgi:hypothetical protein
LSPRSSLKEKVLDFRDEHEASEDEASVEVARSPSSARSEPHRGLSSEVDALQKEDREAKLARRISCAV